LDSAFPCFFKKFFISIYQFVRRSGKLKKISNLIARYGRETVESAACLHREKVD